jgi:catechol 2,3-dioxygenase-like lactoylglutathione lyase family enzyme
MAEHPEVPRVEVEGREALGEAPVLVGAELHQQKADTPTQPPRRGSLHAAGISGHPADGTAHQNCSCYKQFWEQRIWRTSRMTTVSVRYITDDVDAAVAFYVELLGFTVEMRAGPGFAMLSRGDLRLMLNRPGAGGAVQPMPDGRVPEPGGWNRIQIEVSNLEREVDARRAAGASFRNDIVTRRGGSQILLEDPAGNPIELFQPAGA